VDRLKDTPRRGAVHADVVSGGFLLVVAVAYGFVALGIPRGDGEPGPAALPIALAALLSLLALWIVTHGLRSGSKPEPESVPVEQTDIVASVQADRPPRGGAWLAALATLAYVALFQPLGFIVTTAAYAAALSWLFGRDRRILLAVPVGVTVVLFVFFRLALGVRLPLGPFG
jgi:putative tricarboxylic transport membrane protein